MKRIWPVLVLLVASCGGEKGDSAGSKAPDAARTEVERGPVKAVVEVVPGKPRLSDEPTLTLTITAAEGVEVTPPPFGESLGGFLVRDFRQPLPELREGRKVVKQVYRLEPSGSGEQTIHPIPISFRSADGKTHTVETEALTLTVSSIVEQEAPSLASLRAAAGPIPLQGPGTGSIWIAATVLAALAGAVGVIAWRRWRRRPEADTPRLSPRELAHQELQRLIEDDPLGRGDLQTFFVGLTGIVRRYIERTTEIRAPEQTTPEFLRAMQSHPSFDERKKHELKAFLESADLVKFAALRPSKEEIEASFSRAKEFVGLAAPAGAAA
jgi:hypothetical protein